MNGQNENNVTPVFNNQNQVGNLNSNQPIGPSFSAGTGMPPSPMPSPVPTSTPAPIPNPVPAPEPMPVPPSPAPVPGPTPTPTPMPSYVPPPVPPASQYVVPPSPAPESGISVRTMQSDAESLKQSGGLGTMPRTFSPADLAAAGPTYAPAGPTDQEKEQAAKGASRKAEKFVVIGLVVLAIAALAAGIYFFAIPKLFPKAPAPVPVVEEQPTPTPTPVPPPAPVIVPHVSYFLQPVALSQTLTLADDTLATWKASLASAASREGIGTNNFKEISFVDPNGSVVPFVSLLNRVVPNLPAESYADLFEDDSSWFLFFAPAQIWPGGVAKVKSGVTQDQLNAFGVALESADLSNFFLASPGTASSFKDGALPSGKVVRFATFSTSGPVFEYGFFTRDNEVYLLFSASYNGIKEAATRLGF